MQSYPLSEIALHLGIKKKSHTVVSGFAIDSRKVAAGELFFALSGNKVDGHNFLKEARSKGAVGAVVKEDYKGDCFGLETIAVPDVLKALQRLAKAVLEKRKCRVVGITGSLGKTTTKEFTSHLLATTYKVGKSPLSYNSQATLPLSILNNSDQNEILVLEMGMSEPGEMKELVSIAPPDIAVITTVALQHAINFPEGISAIANEKGEILSHPKTELGILNLDMEPYSKLKERGKSKKITFSTQKKEADYFLEEIDKGVRIFSKEEPPIEIALKLPLSVHYQNFLPAFIVARKMGVSSQAIQEAAIGLKLPPMRFEMVQKGEILFINDAYNANPDAMKAAIEAVARISVKGKKIAVLSEMNSLGPFSEEEHEKIAKIALRHVDMLLCLGPKSLPMERIFREGRKFCFRFNHKKELIEMLHTLVKPGDLVLLKGARSWALEEILDHF